MLNFQKIAAASVGSIVREYFTQGKPVPVAPQGVDPRGRDLQSGEQLTAYYTGRDERASWRPDMPQSVARALGINPAHAPKDGELDRLFEAKRADTGAAWSNQKRELSGFDLVFSPDKSASLAAAFAKTPAEKAAIENAILSASDAALRYAAEDLAWARKGKAGQKGADHGEVGWVTFCHHAARPTLALQDGPGGATYLIDAPIAGDPHFHAHNFLMNMVVTEDGRVGSLDARGLTAERVHEYGAYFQAQLADRLRALGVRIGYDESEQAVALADIPDAAVDLFSKRDRQVLADAKQYAAERNVAWDDLSHERKKRILHEASAAGKLGKLKEDEQDIWKAQAAEIGWVHDSVIGKTAHAPLSDAQRFENAYAYAARHLAAEFRNAAVLDHDRLRVLATRGLIGSGISGGRDDVDRVVALLEENGIDFQGERVSLVKGLQNKRMHVTHTEQMRIEQTVSRNAKQAAQDLSAALSNQAIRDAMRTVQRDNPGLQFTDEQKAAIHAMGQGGKLTLLTGVAGAGKTTLLKPLTDAWKSAGFNVVGTSTAWRQADALQDADIHETVALHPLLDSVNKGEFQPDARTVLVVDEVSQVAPRAMLQLLDLQAKTGMTLKLLGDREQCQSIEAGDTIELLRRALPKSALPQILTAKRQSDPRDRKIASLFREGNTAQAFEMKRADGTANLVEGDYDQVIKHIADFYVARSDQLRSQDKSLDVTVTAFTNAEASDISQAIRARLKERGEIGQDESVYKAVNFRGDKPEFFDLAIATGDRLRLYSRTWATIDGKGGSIGNNGDIVEVVGKTANGLTLRSSDGRVGEVEWRRLMDKKTNRLHLGFGRALTVDAAQGMSTRGEHINALPRGTAITTGFKTYTAESRASGKTHTFISKAAVQADITRSRALGDATPITEQDLWRRVEADTANKPYKSLAIDIVSAAQRSRERAVETGLRLHHHFETSPLSEPGAGQKIRAIFEAAAARDSALRLRSAIEGLIERGASALEDAARVARDHLDRLPAVRPAPRPAVATAAPAREAGPVAPPRSAPSPGM